MVEAEVWTGFLKEELAVQSRIFVEGVHGELV